MPATTINLTDQLRLEQGATYGVTFLVTDQNGNPFNLTGYTGSAMLRHSYTDVSASASFACSVDTPPTSGSLTISMPASATDTLDACTYRWDCEVASGSVVFRLFEGKAVVTPSVTK